MKGAEVGLEPGLVNIIYETSLTLSRRLASTSTSSSTSVSSLNPFPAWLTDYGSFNQISNEDLGMVAYTFVICIFSIAIYWFIFSYGRMYNDTLYAPRTEYDPKNAPKKLSNNNMYSWMWELYNISDETILKKSGYDTLTFVRFYRLNYRIFATFAIYAFLVLLPVNGTASTDLEEILQASTGSGTGAQLAEEERMLDEFIEECDLSAPMEVDCRLIFLRGSRGQGVKTLGRNIRIQVDNADKPWNSFSTGKETLRTENLSVQVTAVRSLGRQGVHEEAWRQLRSLNS